MTVAITTHAQKRLIKRSRQHRNNLREQIAAGAYVTLGRSEDTCFVLVYSPADVTWLVVLLSLDGKTVISIWQDWYFLPDGIQTITPKLKQSAKQRYYDFIFSEYLDVPDITPLQITLRVEKENEHKLLSLGAGHSLADPQKRRVALEYLRPHLAPIVAAVAAKRPVVGARYTALFRTPDGTVVAEHTWRHNQKLRKFLKRNK